MSLREAEDRLHEPPKKAKVVHANARGHPKLSERDVNRVLRKLCDTGMWQDVLYAKCAGSMQGRVQEVTP